MIFISNNIISKLIKKLVIKEKKILNTASAVVGRTWMLGIPAPTLPLRPVDKVQHFRFWCLEGFDRIVVVSTIDPLLNIQDKPLDYTWLN